MIALSISTDHITYGYKGLIVPFDRVGEITAKYNYSASGFIDGYRSAKTVKALGNAMIYDFDTGMITLNDMESFLRENGISAILATSRNHQKQKHDKPPCDRFRLFLPLHRSLKIEISDYSAFYEYIAALFDISDAIDKACKDASRFYYPNPAQEIRYINSGFILDADVLEKNFYIIHNAKKEERKAKLAATKPKYIPRVGRKSNEIPRDTQIELRNGEIKYLYEFEYLQGDETAPCRCVNPAHEDRHPSAFIGRSRSGGALQVTCSGCGFTAYMERETDNVQTI